MIFKYAIAWIPMVFIAIANGAARQLGYERIVGELSAHQISCLTGISLFFAYTYVLSCRMPFKNSLQALAVGLIWMALTVIFEFAFGHYAAGHSWERLLQDYNILAGRLWTFVLASLLFMPYIVFKIRSRKL